MFSLATSAPRVTYIPRPYGLAIHMKHIVCSTEKCSRAAWSLAVSHNSL